MSTLYKFLRTPKLPIGFRAAGSACGIKAKGDIGDRLKVTVPFQGDKSCHEKCIKKGG